MAADTRSGKKWEGRRNLAFARIPDELIDRLQETLPTVDGFSRRTEMGLLALWGDPDLSDEVRRKLWDWVDQATKDPSMRDGRGLARQFAEWVLEDAD